MQYLFNLLVNNLRSILIPVCLAQCSNCSIHIPTNSLTAFFSLDGNSLPVISQLINDAGFKKGAASNSSIRANAPIHFIGSDYIPFSISNFILNNYLYSTWVKMPTYKAGEKAHHLKSLVRLVMPVIKKITIRHQTICNSFSVTHSI